MARTHLLADVGRLQAFWPDPLATVNIGASAGGSTASLTTTHTHLRVINTGSVTVFVEFGGATASVATSMPLPAGGCEIVAGDWSGGVTLSAITASGTATLYFTPGEGL